MKVVELFSGNGDITKAFKESGVKAYSVDYDSKKNPDITYDVYKLPESFFKCFKFIWLSPDCTTYSFASHGLHRRSGGIPVSEYAKECDNNNTKLLALLKKLDIPFICENPRCHFRNMDFAKGLHRVTIYYSTYGLPYTKPTDLFSNRKELLEIFDTRASKGSIHLDYCKRYEDFLGRCKMPDKLISDIVMTVKRNLGL